MAELPLTFALETYAARSLNYLDRMVDAEGIPYFDVFWTEPAEAAHDWPDYADVMARQLQAAVMLRAMTGRSAAHEGNWRTRVLGMIGPEGIMRRPEHPWCAARVEAESTCLVLYALVTDFMDSGSGAVHDALERTIGSLERLLETELASEQPRFDSGFMLKSLMAAYRYADCPSALPLARACVGRVLTTGRRFSPDNTFRHGGHMHINLRTLMGLADYALDQGEAELYSRVAAVFRYVLGEATAFGFLPELIGRKGDIVACETCALMDCLGLACTLANHGHPEYWGAAERLTRNQLVESQLVDGSWLHGDDSRPDSEQSSWRDIGGRMVGGWAGWSSPTHILAARETLNAHWGGPELRDKTRAFQNCCGGSGTHALYVAWRNAARLRDGKLWVNMHFDKQLPQATIRCMQPWLGLTRIQLHCPCAVMLRIPEGVRPAETVASAGGQPVRVEAWGGYLELGRHGAGTELEVSYPLPARREEVEIGNPGFRHYRYGVHWKGDTVLRMEPLDVTSRTGYSDFDRREVETFYGAEGPGPLYRRDQMRAEGSPALAPIRRDEGGVDFWYFGEP